MCIYMYVCCACVCVYIYIYVRCGKSRETATKYLRRYRVIGKMFQTKGIALKKSISRWHLFDLRMTLKRSGQVSIKILNENAICNIIFLN